MQLLLICDPASYPKAESEVPAFYRRAAGRDGFAVYHCPSDQVVGADPEDLRVEAVPRDLSHEVFLRLNQAAEQSIRLDAIDLVFCRTLKPFPSGYLTALARWEAHTRFVNRPSSKVLQTRPDFLLSIAAPYMPDSLISGKAAELDEFLRRHGVIVAKRANSAGGRGVFKVWRQGDSCWSDNITEGERPHGSLPELMAHLQGEEKQALQLIRFLPRTLEGDKRVVVVDGEIYGGYLRRSIGGHWVNNVSHDGACSPAAIGAEEREAIRATWPHYRDLELRILGYDFLRNDDGRWLISEINAGNVGGFHRLEQLSGQPVVQRLLTWMEANIRSENSAVEHGAIPSVTL